VRNRVTKLVEVKASELRAHPDNWRLHPQHQRNALSALMREVGMVAAVIARETPEGLQLIDGHLRAELAEDDKIPVLIVDLSEQEAKQILASFDPIGELALIDEEVFARLVPDLGGLMEDSDFRLMISQINNEVIEKEQKGGFSEHIVPGMELEPHEHYDYLVVMARSTQEWNVLCTRLGLEPSKRRHRTGVGRGISASKLLALIGDK